MKETKLGVNKGSKRHDMLEMQGSARDLIQRDLKKEGPGFGKAGYRWGQNQHKGLQDEKELVTNNS